jgi:hypothetical protein
MFSKSVIFGSLLFLASVGAAPMKREFHAAPAPTAAPVRRDCMDDPQACLSQGLGHASSVFSVGGDYASSAVNNPVAQSDASSAMSVAASDASSLWSRVIYGPGGSQATGLVEYVTVNSNGQTITEVSSSGGPVITLAPSGQGTPTTFGGIPFTVATGDVLAAQPSGNGASNDHNSAYRAGVPTAVLGLATVIGAFLAL